MKKASTRLLEQETQTPSPAPDLIPAESSTENLHWDWYSKRGHFITTHLGSHGPVLPFDVTSGDVLRIGVAADVAHINSDALCWRIACLVFQHRTIAFLHYRIIHFHPKGILYRFKIWSVSVGCDLYPVAQTRC